MRVFLEHLYIRLERHAVLYRNPEKAGALASGIDIHQ